MSMTFAIVTPSYNKVRYLRRCVLSVMDQAHPGVDYWLLDSCSTDGSAEVIEKLRAEFAGQLNILVEKDHGQTDAINRGFALARGEIMGWLNADDWYLPRALAQVEHCFQEHPEAGMVYGEARILNGDFRWLGNYPVQPHDPKVMRSYQYIPQPSCFWRRSVWDAVGPLDATLNWGLDWDFFIRVSNRFPVVFLREFLSEAVQDGQHKTATGGPDKARELAMISRRYGGWRNPTNLYCHYVLTLYWVLRPWLNNPATAAAAQRWMERLKSYAMTFAYRMFRRQVMA
jgi:glycosyltransferase involved in cell wall biosynthesis